MITLKCKKHPRYKAVLPPRANCEACIALWSAAVKLGAYRDITVG